MLHLTNFSKRYNDRLILKIDHLELKKGAYWIKGGNGSGKTTLFKSMSGILPFEGDIQFEDGISVKKNPVQYRTRVSYSEAEPQFPGFLTAHDLMRFIGKIRKSPLDEQKYYSELLGLDSFFENPCETYSSGMLKKLGLALTFLGTPQVIILDEPLITLDQQTREVLLGLCRKKINEGVLLLISSHQNLQDSDLVVQQVLSLENQTLSPQ